MQPKTIIQAIVLILTFTVQLVNAKPRRVSIDQIDQLIKQTQNSQQRTLLSQDSVDDIFSWMSSNSPRLVQFRVQGSRTRESRIKFKEIVQYL